MSIVRRVHLFRVENAAVSLAAAAVIVCSVGCDGGAAAKPDGGGSQSDGGADAGGTGGGLAVLSSDYASTSVSTYNPQSGKLVDDCINSGTIVGPSGQKLSGDVTLPSAPQASGELVLLDRINATLTFLAPATCAIRAQLSVSTGGFKSNPHDVVTLSATKAYVTRYDANAMPSADPNDLDDGEDLLIIDPSIPMILGRIALGQYATGVAATEAKPDRAVLAEGKVYVTLNSLATDYSAVGPGRVVVVDPANDTVIGMIDLPDYTDCSGIEYLASQKKVYVACGGASADGPTQTAKSALVEIDLSGATPTVGRIIAAAAMGTRPISYANPVVFGETAFLVTAGTLDPADFKTTVIPDSFFAATLGGPRPFKFPWARRSPSVAASSTLRRRSCSSPRPIPSGPACGSSTARPTRSRPPASSSPTRPATCPPEKSPDIREGPSLASASERALRAGPRTGRGGFAAPASTKNGGSRRGDVGPPASAEGASRAQRGQDACHALAGVAEQHRVLSL